MPTNNTPPVKPLYAKATDPTFTKRIYHQEIPMMLFSEDGKQLYLPMVIGTSRELAEIEENSYQDTVKHFHGTVPKLDQHSNWKAIEDYHRAAWTVYVCCRQPTDLKQRFFLSKQDVEDTYNWDELGLLMANYLSMRKNQDIYKSLDPNSVDPYQDLIDQIVKDVEKSDFFLNSLTTHTVNLLVKFLVAERQSYKNISGLSGSPSDNIITTK